MQYDMPINIQLKLTKVNKQNKQKTFSLSDVCKEYDSIYLLSLPTSSSQGHGGQWCNIQQLLCKVHAGQAGLSHETSKQAAIHSHRDNVELPVILTFVFLVCGRTYAQREHEDHQERSPDGI